MKVKYPMKKFFCSAIILLGITACSGTVDEPNFKIVKQTGAIEIREYAPTSAAVTTVAGERDEAMNDGFRRLFKYIDGENSGKQSIEMTAPVAAQAGASQKIEMTAPVAAESTSAGWKVRFYMPNNMAYEALPTPNNAQITLEKIPSHQKAVIRFSGVLNDDNIKQHEQILRQHLEANNIAYNEPPSYAGYNPPWTLWFLRRNEVMFDLQ